jgi:hypothetical protein
LKQHALVHTLFTAIMRPLFIHPTTDDDVLTLKM